MKVAIIGAGNVGKALGTSIGKAGHSVVFASRGESAAAAAGEVGGSVAAAREAAAQADLIVLAVPYGSAHDVANEIAPVARGKVVIDATNPLAADLSGLAVEAGSSAAENLASWLPGAAVVKAFNTMFASNMGNPGALGEKLDALFATDDASAREAVAALIVSMGFQPVWVGGLSRARQLEAMAFLNITLQVATGGYWNTAYKLVAPPAASVEHRATAAAGAAR